MEIFVKILQGSYAYLLIFQVLMVSGLLLALIWLLMKRTQEAAEQAVNHPVISLSTSTANTVPAGPDLEKEELKAKVDALEEENQRVRIESEEIPNLRDKLKYLESKLLEYEILQEEIGTLSALKLENEGLKQELVQLQSQLTRLATTPAPIPPAVEAAPIPVPTPAPVAEPEPEPPAAIVIEPPTPMAQTAPAPPAAAEDAAAGLEGLLKQIDELTSSNLK